MSKLGRAKQLNRDSDWEWPLLPIYNLISGYAHGNKESDFQRPTQGWAWFSISFKSTVLEMQPFGEDEKSLIKQVCFLSKYTNKSSSDPFPCTWQNTKVLLFSLMLYCSIDASTDTLTHTVGHHSDLQNGEYQQLTVAWWSDLSMAKHALVSSARSSPWSKKHYLGTWNQNTKDDPILSTL